MRTIKFRGFDAIGEKGWVYGDLVHNQRVTTYGLAPRVMVGGYEVVPETVGQYTGLKDKNGKEIYEGDLIEYTYKICEGDDALTYNGAVSFIDGCFCVEEDCDFTLWYVIEVCDEYGGIMVIGNIHDNPELLEQREPNQNGL